MESNTYLKKKLNLDDLDEHKKQTMSKEKVIELIQFNMKDDDSSRKSSENNNCIGLSDFAGASTSRPVLGNSKSHDESIISSSDHRNKSNNDSSQRELEKSEFGLINKNIGEKEVLKLKGNGKRLKPIDKYLNIVDKIAVLEDLTNKKLEHQRAKTIKQKIEKIEFQELVEKNNQKIEECKSLLFYDVDHKNELMDYIKATGNLDTRNREFPTYIILPNSRFRRTWNLFVLMCAVISIIIIPIDVGWNISCINDDYGNYYDKFQLISGIFMLTDVGINFITATLDEKYRYIFDIKQIAITYLMTNFFFDIIAAMPYNFFIPNDNSTCFDPNSSNPKLICLFGLFRIVKASHMFHFMEELFSKYATIIRLLKLFLMILYFAHSTGNVLVGNSISFSKIIFRDCIAFNDINLIKTCRKKIVQNRFADIYTYSVFTGYYIISSNETLMQENWEKFIFVIIAVMSMGFTASIFGNVAILISNMSFGVSPVVQEKIDVMKEYMKYMKFENSFIDTIESYHVNIWSKQRTMLYSDAFFSDLNASLLKLILIDQWKNTFFSVGKWLSDTCNEYFLFIVPNLKPKIFMNKDVIITEGESTTELYFISDTGSVSIKISGQWVKNMGRGEMFGEIAIFLRSKRRTATVTSLNDSDYLVLSQDVFTRSLQDFPETCQKFKELGINRLMSSMKLYPLSIFAKLVPKNDLKDYLIRKSIYLEDYEEDEFYMKREHNDHLVNIDKYEKEFFQVKSHLTNSLENMKKFIDLVGEEDGEGEEES